MGDPKLGNLNTDTMGSQFGFGNLKSGFQTQQVDKSKPEREKQQWKSWFDKGKPEGKSDKTNSEKPMKSWRSWFGKSKAGGKSDKANPEKKETKPWKSWFNRSQAKTTSAKSKPGSETKSWKNWFNFSQTGSKSKSEKEAKSWKSWFNKSKSESKSDKSQAQKAKKWFDKITATNVSKMLHKLIPRKEVKFKPRKFTGHNITVKTGMKAKRKRKPKKKLKKRPKDKPEVLFNPERPNMGVNKFGYSGTQIIRLLTHDTAFLLRALRMVVKDKSNLRHPPPPLTAWLPTIAQQQTDPKVAKFCSKSYIHCVLYLSSISWDLRLNTRYDYPTRQAGAEQGLCGERKFNIFCPASLRLEGDEKILNNIMKSSDQEMNDLYRMTTSALRYMCWYTLHRIPYLANLLQCDSTDPMRMTPDGVSRANNDRSVFGCALYSFCPDPC